MDAETFARTHTCKSLLIDKAAELRKRAERYEALAATLPDYLGSEAAETAMRTLILERQD
jgi:hypothetical protein